jgi:hypothetical protein
MIASGNGQADTGDDPAALARSLEPVIRESCDGRLGEIEWFRASWQRGGAATGYATWSPGDADDVPVIVKLPVGSTELNWTVRLGDHGLDRDVVDGQVPHPTPRVLGSGQRLGGHDLGWLVIERLEGETVAGDLTEKSMHGLLNAAVEFQARADVAGVAMGDAPETPDWQSALERTREWVADNKLTEAPRWKKAVQSAQKLLPSMLKQWESRPINTWCHGDLHPGNAMHMPQHFDHPDRCVLIDLALVHAGHWVEDAVYLEHLFWGHEDKLFGIRPVRHMRKQRKERGLAVNSGDAKLADIKRLLIASTAPSFFGVEGDDRYMHRALCLAEEVIVRITGS